jgi:hypothetical protein
MFTLGLRPALRSLLLISAFGFATLSATAFGQTGASPAGPARGQVNRVVEAANVSGRKVIPGHLPAWATAAADQGAIPDTQQVHLIFGLSRSTEVETAFRQLLEDQQNPSSPRFHQWLTPAQVGEQYGPTQHDIDALTAWLTSQGITVDAVLPSRIFIQASAPASVIGSAFQTSLHTFALKSGNLQAPTAEPSLPATLSPIVSYIGGLATIPYHTHSHVVPDAMASASATGPLGAKSNFTASSGYHALVPGDFATIYDLKPAYNAGIKGNGQKVAIIGGSQLLPSDIANYETLSALPSYSPNTIVPVGASFSDPGYVTADQTEGMLDFERAYGTAPGATIDFLISKNWLNGTVTQNLLLYAINTLNDQILSLSFGACEALQTPAYVNYEDTTFSQAAAQGISVFVSSGDAGGEGCEGLTTASTLYLSISDYCASGSVTCVGGTEFADTASPSTYWSSSNGVGAASALSYIPEGGWNDPLYSAGVYRAASSGGGVSTIIAKPSWQKGTGVPADGFRDVPDISFSGSVHNAYIVCQNASGGNGCDPANFGALAVGGTSASAPSMAGVAALINQKLGGRQGNMNPLLYKLAASTPTAFHDATPASSGVTTCSLTTPSMCNNSVPTTTTALTPALSGYALTTGYDQVTGLGSLDVNAFLTAAGLPTPTGVVTASPATITISQTVKFTATFTAPSGSGGTPTGTVQFYSNGTAIGSVLTLANGSATTTGLAFAPAGTYAITASYSGDSSFGPSISPALSLVVTNPTAIASTTTVTATSTSPTTIQAVGFTANVAGSGGTATGTVQFVVDGLSKGVPVTLANGSATLAPFLLPAGPHLVSAKYSGDISYSASTSNVVTVGVLALASTTVGSATPSTINLSQTTNISFTVSGSGGGPTPTGSVSLLYGGSSLGSVTLVNGTAAAPLGGFTTPGSYTFTGQYSGDSVYSASQSASFTVIVVNSIVPLTSHDTLSITPTSVVAGNTITGTSTVTGVSGSPTPTGTVTLWLTGTTTQLGTATLNSNGVAAVTQLVTAAAFPPGTYSVYSLYSGDGVYAGSTSNNVTVTVTSAAGFTVSGTPSTLSIKAGAGTGNTIAFNYASVNGFAGTITQTCSLAIVSGTATVAPSCSSASPSVALASGGTGSDVVTISTIAPHNIGGAGANVSLDLRNGAMGGVAFAGLLLLVFPGRRRALRNWRSLVAMLILSAAMFTVAGCSSSGTTTTAPPVLTGGTTAGTYTLTVIGTSGGQTQTATSTITIN